MAIHAGRLYILLAVLVLAGATLLRLADPFFLQALRLIAFDSYQRLGPQAYDPALPVRIVDIDEESLARVGQWPWPRTTMAELLRKLTAQGAAVVAFDILFAEPDRTSPEQAIKQLTPEAARAIEPAFAGQRSHDDIFADSIREAPTVLATALSNRPSARPLAAKAGFGVAGDDPKPFLAGFAGSMNNLPALEGSAAGIGAINWLPDRDQVIRRMPLVYRVGDQFVPTLITEALRVGQGASTYVLKASNASGETAFGRKTGLNHIKVGALEIPTDADGGIWLEFRPSNPSTFIPAWKVLAGDNDPGDIKDKIVLVGTSAPGLVDLRATPLDPSIAGVEVHAQAIEHILAGRSLTRPDYALALELSLVLLVGAMLTFVLPRISAGASAILGVSVIVLIFLGGWIAYRYAGLLFDPAYPALTLAVLVGAATLYVYRRVEQQRGEVRRAFAHYVAPSVVDEIIAHPEKLELGGQVRDLTVMFCDVRNFTAISETMTAQELTQFINQLLTPLTEIILEQRGTIDKYMGDAIMAFWNAPLDEPDHRRRACEAAVGMVAEMEKLNQYWRGSAEAGGYPFRPVAIGVGINSGKCCVGNLGSSQRFDYSAIGDDVNVASRIEGLSKVYGLATVVGESTASGVGDLGVLEIDLMRVKGRSQPSRLYTINKALGCDEGRLDLLIPHHIAMLKSYRSCDWDCAEAEIAACRDVGIPSLDVLYAMYRSRIQAWRGKPPPDDWDGASTALEK